MADGTIMSTEQHSDSAPEQHSDSEQDSKLSNLSNTDVRNILIGKLDKLDHISDYVLFYGDFCKFSSCTGWVESEYLLS